MTTKKILLEALSWVKGALFALAIVIIINVFLFQPYIVNGSSMEPTFTGVDPYNESESIGDRVMVFKTPFILGGEPKSGDIVVIDSRTDYSRTIKDVFLDSPIISLISDSTEDHNYWIKRVIGEPGDYLEFIDGKIYRNGEMLEEDYIKSDMEQPFEPITVPENAVFVMGDNRNNSLDSRSIGPVEIDNVIGKVFLRYYPLEKVNTF